jgi:hypothetical protein
MTEPLPTANDMVLVAAVNDVAVEQNQAESVGRF